MDIPRSPFADDDGSADPVIAGLSLRWAQGELDTDSLADALRQTRLLVPVVAHRDSSQQNDAELEVEKDSHMAMPLMVRADGQRGLLAFLSTDSLQRWDRTARAIPVWGLDAARAAQAEPAALVIDVMGPVRIALTEAALARVAGSDRG